MTHYTERQLKRFNNNGYKVIRLGEKYALVRNYSKNSSKPFKKYFSFYGLAKVDKLN